MLNDLIEMCKERLGSYEKLSWKLEIAPTVISDWKAKRRKPNAFQVMQMAEIVGFDQYQTLCLVMEEVDTKNAEQWKKWRPYGDSNPGYRRERAMSQLSYFMAIFIVKFCNFIVKQVGVSKHHVNVQELNAHNVV